MYPPIARAAHISGDVTIMLGIRRDGSIQSVAVIGGPPLLHQAALDSAQQSQFECRNCSETTTSYSLIYAFQLIDPDRHTTTGDLHVTRSENHVTAIDKAVPICDLAAIKARAAKCLYLRKCSWR